MSRQMKDSGIEWIGEIPTTWHSIKLKKLASFLNGYAFQSGEYVSTGIFVTRITNVDDGYLNKRNPLFYPISKIDEYKHVMLCEDDILITLTGNVGFVGIVRKDYLPAALNQRVGCIRVNKMVYVRYLYYVLMSHRFREFATLYSNGTAQLNMSSEWLMNSKVCIPELNEQRIIVSYLDSQCALIDNIIEKTKASIEEYKKLKQAIITEAVTKGVRGERPMKESGIEWVDSFPAEWKIKRFKYVITQLIKGNGITKDEVNSDGDTPCVRYGEIYTKYENSFMTCASATNAELISPRQYFSYGDLLFTCTGELIEEIGKSTAYIGNEQCLAGGDILIAKHNQNPVFLNYVMNSAYTQVQKSCDKTKLKVVHISAANIANIRIGIPDREEQNEIAEYLDKKCEEIKRIIVAKQQQVKVIEELKKSLIYEYVTGKSEVDAAIAYE